jgi:cellulose synthase/poly-beta-1,6-N-acetylglucosamine synthase-like glycosyltransferase
MIVVFWICIASILYVYVLFPVMVILRGSLGGDSNQYSDVSPLPFVSVIIAAYNESKTIRKKLDNLISLDYPKDRIEFVIASDGSNDGTDAIVREYEEQGVKLLSLPRRGKAAALNSAVMSSTGKILVFSDANSMYEREAIRILVRPFADSEVGGAAGNQCYLSEREVSAEDAGERTYWKFDRILKLFQSRAGNVISATGAIYAIRRALFQPIPDGVTDDFFTSTGVIAQGYRLTFVPDAVAYEPVSGSNEAEFLRKVRIITRGLRAVLVRRQLLNPLRYGFYSLQLISHKVLRRVVVFPLLVLLATSLSIWQFGTIYRAVALGQLAFYCCSFVGLLFRDTKLRGLKIFALPFYFCMVNAAAFVAVINVLRGHNINRWEPQRGDISESIMVR